MQVLLRAGSVDRSVPADLDSQRRRAEAAEANTERILRAGLDRFLA
jgi:hypothetical protein